MPTISEKSSSLDFDNPLEECPRKSTALSTSPDVKPPTKIPIELSVSNLPLPITSRHPMNQEQFNDVYRYEIPVESTNVVVDGAIRWGERFYKPFTSSHHFWKTLVGFLPILHWLPNYQFNFLTYDVLGGLTVGIMHVPQGIAYAVLAGQEPVIGLYTSLFPVLGYMLFGTSKHCSIGSFAVVALMSGNVVRTYSTMTVPTNGTEVEYLYTPIEVASTLTMVIGLMQVMLAVLGLDVVTTYFSDELVGGFTTGATMHVAVTQLKDIFGIYTGQPRKGPGNLFMKVWDLAWDIYLTNWVTLLVSICCLGALATGRYMINPWFQKKTNISIPLPFDLIMVIIATFVSMSLGLGPQYQVRTVGVIPAGLPLPVLPKASLIVSMLPEALSITVVIMAVHISLAKMFASKYRYEIDTKQEFYALGFTSMFSGLFSTFPSSCSLARTMVNGNAGTKTQLSGLFSCLFVFSIVMFIGKLLEPLPMCILASIILVALLGMFEKFSKLPSIWRLSKIDFCIWIVAFVATTFYDVMEGLTIAIIFALFTTVSRQQWPKWHILGAVVGTTEYRDIDRYKNVYFINGICVFRFDSPLIFLNVARFRNTLLEITSEWSTKFSMENDEHLLISEKGQKGLRRRSLVVDCSGFVYSDIMGVNCLKDVFVELRELGVDVVFAASKSALREMFQVAGLHAIVPLNRFFPTIHDAVGCIQMEQDNALEFSNDVDTSDEIH